MPGGNPHKAPPYVLPLSLAIIAVLGLTPQPVAKAPAIEGNVAKAIEESAGWSRAMPAVSVTLRIGRNYVRPSGIVPDMLVKQPTDDSHPAAFRSDRRNLLWAIEIALLSEHAIESGTVTVTATRDGSVALTGDVQTPQEKRRAGEVAAAVRGVASLDNRLSVTSASERPDRAIKTDIEERLNRDSQIDPFFIHIVVTNGMVTLTGAVGTAAEKRRAVENAWVAGVRHVEASKLNVRDWVHRRKHIAEKWAASTGTQAEPTQPAAELPRNFLP